MQEERTLSCIKMNVGINMDKNAYFRKIPKVDTLLKEDAIQELCSIYGRDVVLEAIHEELERLRDTVRQADEKEILEALSSLKERIAMRLKKEEEYSLRPVINATGILLHTNLGRAPLGQFQMDAMLHAAQGYSNLEYDLEQGKRSRRFIHYAEEIKKVTGAEDAVAVNNNAAAVTLMLSALAKGKEVIVSRGELIEIGGRFRVPEVMEQSGAVLKEVGCTNRTRISDYETAINENTGALLKVHTSNYKIVGFTEEVSIQELAKLGEKYHLPVLMDMGSGVLIDLEEYGLPHEPTVQEILKKGADVVSFSGDKLLGGPQAGILAGKEAYIKKMEEHPLMRAVRLDKCITAGLAATFRAYRDKKKAEKSIPVLQMLSRSQEELKEQAKELKEELLKTKSGERILIEESAAMMGGGSLPGEKIPSYALTITPQGESCEAFAKRLRNLPLPVICHIKEEKIFLDMRTVMPKEKLLLLEGIKSCLRTDSRQ